MKKFGVYEGIIEKAWKNEDFSILTISNLNIFIKY